MTKVKERTMHIVFLVAACMSILAVAMICLFMFANGVPAIRQIGFVNFIFGKTWMPGANKFGIFPMIIGSIYVTAGAIIIGVSIGLLCAVFMAKFCPPKLHKIMKPAVDLLAGIPSIVYGFFGLVVITPMIRNTFGGSGKKHSDRLHPAWNHDSANHHQCIGISNPRGSGKLLRRSIGTR